ncbi:unnamed protein product [Parnassius mnemosyne]|uniref:Uncharacterized protein n=1 Tax=Parnassius mnemosyne TaxID=213953 RepID=A0AAV1LU75_9NEOP
MKRSQNILNLALSLSGISTDQEETSTSSKADDHATQKITLPQDNRYFLEHGEDLLSFKNNIRENALVNYYPDSYSSSSKKEPFSPDVSEYFPYDQDDSTNSSQHSSQHNIPLQEIPTATNIPENITTPEGTARKVKRTVPKKATPGRKRNHNRENWKRNVSKRKKNSGEEYLNRRGILVPKKAMKSGCNNTCTKKCKERLMETTRHAIFKDFWGLGDHSRQADFVSRFVDRVPRKQITASVIGQSRRHWSFQYYLYENGDRKRVCKKMFLDTLCISDMWLQTIYKKMDKEGTGLIAGDLRGRHNNRKNVIPNEVKESVRNHISLIPIVDSHYVRKRTSKLYFEETLTYPALYRLYVDWMKENRPLEQVANSRQYKDIFYNEYNIEFYKPKKDLCILCDRYKRGSEKEKDDMKLEYTLHIANKTVVREVKETYKFQSKQSDIIVTAAYDLQKVLTTPQSEVALFYYKRKFAVYNFTIYDIGKAKGYSLLKKKLNWDWNSTGKKMSWTKIQHIKIENENPDIIYFQYEYLSDQYLSINLAVKPTTRITRTKRAQESIQCEQSNDEESIPLLYNKVLPISTAKYKDLVSLCKCKAIPDIYHNFYFNLPHSTQVAEDNGSDDEN